MSNRLGQEFPSTRWPLAIPPIGPDGSQLYIRHANQLRAEAMNTGVRLLARWAGGAFRRMVRFVRCASYGVAKRAPDRLTGPCR